VGVWFQGDHCLGCVEFSSVLCELDLLYPLCCSTSTEDMLLFIKKIKTCHNILTLLFKKLEKGYKNKLKGNRETNNKD
jgi:hypothetical protein